MSEVIVKAAPRPHPAMGQRVHIGDKHYGLIGVMETGADAVALIAAWEEEVAPVFVVPWAKLQWSVPLGCWCYGDAPPRLLSLS